MRDNIKSTRDHIKSAQDILLALPDNIKSMLDHIKSMRANIKSSRDHIKITQDHIKSSRHNIKIQTGLSLFLPGNTEIQPDHLVVRMADLSSSGGNPKGFPRYPWFRFINRSWQSLVLIDERNL